MVLRSRLIITAALESSRGEGKTFFSGKLMKDKKILGTFSVFLQLGNVFFFFSPFSISFGVGGSAASLPCRGATHSLSVIDVLDSHTVLAPRHSCLSRAIDLNLNSLAFSPVSHQQS